ncbi:MAG: ankyrin repeat domain-containing protein [Candidatus Babeliales bacterium]
MFAAEQKAEDARQKEAEAAQKELAARKKEAEEKEAEAAQKAEKNEKIGCIDGLTVLHSAVINENVDSTRVISKNLALLNKVDKHGKAPVHYAVKASSEGIAHILTNILLDKKITKVNLSDLSGVTPLLAAANAGYTSVVNLLLEQGAHIDAADNMGRTALLVAMKNNDPKTVTFLVENGADVKVKDKFGNTASSLARSEAMEHIVKHCFGRNELHSEVIKQNEEKVAQLVLQNQDNKEFLNQQDDKGAAPLHYAMNALNWKKAFALASTLLSSANTDVNVRDFQGSTPFHWAAARGDKEIASLFVTRLGKDVNQRNNAGQTALHIAAREGHADFIDCLIVGNADKNVTDNEGNTPLHLAAERGHLDVVSLLLASRGVNIDATNNDVKTALMLARENKKEDVAKFIASQKACQEASGRDKVEKKELVVVASNTATPTVTTNVPVSPSQQLGGKQEKKGNGKKQRIYKEKKKGGEEAAKPDTATSTATTNVPVEPSLQLGATGDQDKQANTEVKSGVVETSQGDDTKKDSTVNDSSKVCQERQPVTKETENTIISQNNNAGGCKALQPAEKHEKKGKGKKKREDSEQPIPIAPATLTDVVAPTATTNVPVELSQQPVMVGAEKQEEAKIKELEIQLCRAAASGNNEEVKKLLDSGVSVNARGLDGKTALQVALWRDKRQTVKLLLEYKALDGAKVKYLNELISLAQKKGNSESVSIFQAKLQEELQATSKNKIGKNVAGATKGKKAPAKNECMKENNEEKNEGGAVTVPSSPQVHDNEEKKDQVESSSTEQNNACLFEAAEKGDIDEIKHRLELGAKVNARDGDGNTALHFAAKAGNNVLAAFLIDQGAEVNAKGDKGNAALHFAAKAGNEELVTLLLNKHAEVNIRNNYRETPLHEASKGNQPKAVKLLIDRGADVKATDKDGLTPELRAKKMRNNGVTKFFKDMASATATPKSEPCVNATGEEPESAEKKEELTRVLNEAMAKALVDQQGDSIFMNQLLCAIKSGELGLIKSLIKQKTVDFNMKIQPDLYTFLHLAVDSNQIEVVKFLVRKKVDVNAKDADGRTPLFFAVDNGNLEIAKFLVENNAIDVVKADGTTLLHCAVKRGNVEIVKILVEKGANVNAIDEIGATPLHGAAVNGYLEIVKFLVEHGAKVNVMSKQGLTPLHAAVNKQAMNVVRYLLANGADVYLCAGREGVTPLQLATKNGWKEGVKFLKERQAEADFAAQNMVASLKEDIKNCPKNGVGNATTGGAVSESGETKEQKEPLEHCSAAREETPKGQFFTAVTRGHLGTIESLIKSKKVDINVKFKPYFTSALHIAADRHLFKVVQLLRELGADVELQDKDGRTPLFIAVESGTATQEEKNEKLEIVKFLAKNGANVNACNMNKETPLHFAAKNGWLEGATLLVKHGADVDAKNLKEETPLFLAINANCFEVINFLEKCGADASLVAEHVAKSLEEIVEKCQKKGPKKGNGKPADTVCMNTVGGAVSGPEETKDKDTSSAQPPMSYASSSSASGVMGGAFFNKGVHNDSTGHTTELHLAVKEGREKDVSAILNDKEKNPKLDINAKDEDGLTALHLATIYQSLAVIECLVVKGNADVNIPDVNGNTVLHLAVRENYVDIIKFLLAHGANVKAKNKYEGSVLAVAAICGHLDAMKLLVEKVDALDPMDIKRAIDFALSKSYDEIVALLESLL